MITFYYPKKEEGYYRKTSKEVDVLENVDEEEYVPSIIEYACEAMKLIIMNKYRERKPEDKVRSFFESIYAFESAVFDIRVHYPEYDYVSQAVLSKQSERLTDSFLSLME